MTIDNNTEYENMAQKELIIRQFLNDIDHGFDTELKSSTINDLEIYVLSIFNARKVYDEKRININSRSKR